MDDAQHQPPSEEHREESTLLKLQEDFTRSCTSAVIAAVRSRATGNSAPTAGYGSPRTAQAAATRCPRSGRMPAPDVAWPSHPSSPETWARVPGVPVPGSLHARSGVAGRPEERNHVSLPYQHPPSLGVIANPL